MPTGCRFLTPSPSDNGQPDEKPHKMEARSSVISRVCLTRIAESVLIDVAHRYQSTSSTVKSSFSRTAPSSVGPAAVEFVYPVSLPSANFARLIPQLTHLAFPLFRLIVITDKHCFPFLSPTTSSFKLQKCSSTSHQRRPPQLSCSRYNKDTPNQKPTVVSLSLHQFQQFIAVCNRKHRHFSVN
ncbi:hypothetical protein Tcan_09575 [Toxocara canis]|uniref:Uncharacterized protein n=1 Tax=Toxocara canis TaxID=6265 RepID=A0A0B2VGA9_TOXCA|nr:hypothetical protein Tcan_09575 [Toxocara canis]